MVRAKKPETIRAAIQFDSIENEADDDITFNLGEKWCVFGQSGTGKSYFVIKYLIKQLYAEADKTKKFQIIYISPFIPNISPNFQTICTENTVNNLSADADNFFQFLPMINRKKLLSVLNPHIRLCRPTVYIFEEAHLLFGNSDLERSESDLIKFLITVGRNVGQSACFITQRPALVSKTILTQSVKIVSFRMTHKADLSHLANVLTDEEIQYISVLKNRHFMIKNCEEGETRFFSPIGEHNE